MNVIRVGIIRCDLHAKYYGVLMAPHDPIALREDLVYGGYGASYYFYTAYNQPTRLMIPPVEGFRITRVWDEDRQRAESMAKIWNDQPRVCDSFEEVSDDVDLVFIADCVGDGSDHYRLAEPGLKKGVPTFIDKPLAFDIDDAVRIVRLANEHGVPMMSLSLLKETPQVAYFHRRLEEIGAPEFGIIKGGGPSMDGHIHAISFAQRVFGNGVESVECMGPTPLAYLHLDYGSKPDRPSAGVMINCASGGSPSCAMYASAYSKLGAIHSPPIDDYVFPYGAARILEKIKKMVATGVPQEPYEDMLEGIEIATAARIAQRERRRVYLKRDYPMSARGRTEEAPGLCV